MSSWDQADADSADAVAFEYDIQDIINKVKRINIATDGTPINKLFNQFFNIVPETMVNMISVNHTRTYATKFHKKYEHAFTSMIDAYNKKRNTRYVISYDVETLHGYYSCKYTLHMRVR